MIYTTNFTAMWSALGKLSTISTDDIEFGQLVKMRSRMLSPLVRKCTNWVRKLSLTMLQKVELPGDETLVVTRGQSTSETLKSPHKTLGKFLGIDDMAVLSSSKVEMPEFGGR